MTRPDFRSPRLFVDAPLAAGGMVPLDKPQLNYLVTVLRLGEGDAVLAFNGRDGEWRTAIRATGKRTVGLEAREALRPQPEPSGLVCAFAPLKHARLDYMVQKAVEMGVGVLQPVLTRRTQVARVNLDRMRANVVEAAEQCGVLALPTVHADARFDDWLAAWPSGQPLVFCDEMAETSDPLAVLRSAGIERAPGAPLALVIGPEGGFADDERRALLSRPTVVRLSLGPRILRADTAAVAALALVQAALGDWR